MEQWQILTIILIIGISGWKIFGMKRPMREHGFGKLITMIFIGMGFWRAYEIVSEMSTTMGIDWIFMLMLFAGGGITFFWWRRQDSGLGG